MKVLLITTSLKSIWVRLFIEKVLNPMGFEIYVQKNPLEDNEYDCFYKDMGVTYCFDYTSNNVLGKIPKIGFLYNFIKRYMSMNNGYYFDYIIVIYGNFFNLRLAQKAASNNTNTIIWYIGSDILRANNIEKKLMRFELNKLLPTVVCVNEKLKKVIEKQMTYKGKMEICDFGNSQLEIIDRILESNVNIKEKFHIDPNQMTITVGYNASAKQQHLNIIEAINNVETLEKDKIHLILPMTYNGTQGYIESVKNSLEKNNFEYTIITEYMNSTQMGNLWVATDVFIHAQTTDAFSSSLMESLYAGCNVFNGAWNEYPELKEWKIEYSEFTDFEQLTEQLQNYMYDCKKKRNNVSKIKEYFSWEICCEKWEKILEKTSIE